MKVVIVGFGWAGYEAAITCKLLRPDVDVIVISNEDVPAYCRCGLTDAIAGYVKLEDLILSPLEHYKSMGIDVLLNYEVIDATNNHIIARSLIDGRDLKIQFDKMIIATGAEPTKPDIKGLELQGVFKLRTLSDARKIINWAKRSGHAVVYGAGFLGLQVADALTKIGLKTTVVEPMESIMPTILDVDMALRVEEWIKAHGVTVIKNFKSGELHGKDFVQKLLGDGVEVKCDLMVLATKVKPNTELACKMGIQLGETGAINVNERMETSVPEVYAAGDCIEVKEVITGRRVKAQVATTAIREARVAAINALGGNATYHGTTLSAISKVFGLEIGVVGFSESLCRSFGLDVASTTLELNAKSKYYPEKTIIKLIAEKNSGRIIGGQAIGHGASYRANLLSLAISKGLTVHDLAKMELSYCPSLTPEWDPIIRASRALIGEVKR